MAIYVMMAISTGLTFRRERGQAIRALRSDVQAVPRQNPQRYVLQEAYQVGQEPLCSSPLTMAIYVMMALSAGLFFFRRERGQAIWALRSDVQAVPRQNPQRYVLQEAYQVGQEPLCFSPLTMAIYVMMAVSTGLFFRQERGQAVWALRSDVQTMPRQNLQRYVLQDAYQVGQEPLCSSPLTLAIYVKMAVSDGLYF